MSNGGATGGSAQAGTPRTGAPVFMIWRLISSCYMLRSFNSFSKRLAGFLGRLHGFMRELTRNLLKSLFKAQKKFFSVDFPIQYTHILESWLPPARPCALSEDSEQHFKLLHFPLSHSLGVDRWEGRTSSCHRVAVIWAFPQAFLLPVFLP